MSNRIEYIKQYIKNTIKQSLIYNILYYILKFQLIFLIKIKNIIKKNIKIPYIKIPYINLFNKNKYTTPQGSLINGITACIIFLPIYIYTKSYLLLIIIINSILYHIIFPYSVIIRYIDICSNIIIGLIIICLLYYNFDLIIIFILSLITINYIYLSSSKLYLCDNLLSMLSHSILVQFLAGILIIKLYYNKINNKNLIFI